MQQTPGHQGKRPRNQNAPDVDADHIVAVCADVAAPDAADGERNAGEDKNAKEVNETEVVEDARSPLPLA